MSEIPPLEAKYPRSYRVTYMERRRPVMEMHNDHILANDAAAQPDPKVRVIDCHLTWTDPHFMHFSIMKRLSEENGNPVWLHVVSIPFDLVLFVELVRDDSDHTVPLRASNPGHVVVEDNMKAGMH